MQSDSTSKMPPRKNLMGVEPNVTPEKTLPPVAGTTLASSQEMTPAHALSRESSSLHKCPKVTNVMPLVEEQVMEEQSSALGATPLWLQPSAGVGDQELHRLWKEKVAQLSTVDKTDSLQRKIIKQDLKEIKREYQRRTKQRQTQGAEDDIQDLDTGKKQNDSNMLPKPDNGKAPEGNDIPSRESQKQEADKFKQPFEDARDDELSHPRHHENKMETGEAQKNSMSKTQRRKAMKRLKKQAALAAHLDTTCSVEKGQELTGKLQLQGGSRSNLLPQPDSHATAQKEPTEEMVHPKQEETLQTLNRTDEDSSEKHANDPIIPLLCNRRPRPSLATSLMKMKNPGTPLAIKKESLFSDLGLSSSDEEAIPSRMKSNKLKYRHSIGGQTRTTPKPDPILIALAKLLERGKSTQMAEVVIFQYSNICMTHASGCCLMGYDCSYSHLPAHHNIITAYNEERRKQGHTCERLRKYARLASKFQQQVNAIALEMAGTECSNYQYILTKKKMQAKGKAEKHHYQKRAKLLRQYILGHLLLEDAKEIAMLKKEMKILFSNNITKPSPVKGRFTMTSSVALTMEEANHWLASNTFMEVNGKALWDLERNANYSDVELFKSQWREAASVREMIKRWRLKEKDRPWMISVKQMTAREHEILVRLEKAWQQTSTKQERITMWTQATVLNCEVPLKETTIIPLYTSFCTATSKTVLKYMERERPWLNDTQEEELVGQYDKEEQIIRGYIREGRNYSCTITQERENFLRKMKQANQKIRLLMEENVAEQDPDKNVPHKTPNSQLRDVGNNNQIKKSGNQEESKKNIQENEKVTAKAQPTKTINDKQAQPQQPPASPTRKPALKKSNLSTDSPPFTRVEPKKRVSWKTEMYDTSSSDRRPLKRESWQQDKMCRYYLQGDCRKGVHCAFYHADEQKLKSPARYNQLCRYERTGGCIKGNLCNWIHVGQRRNETSGEKAGDQNWSCNRDASAPKQTRKVKPPEGPCQPSPGTQREGQARQVPKPEVLTLSKVVPQTTEHAPFVQSRTVKGQTEKRSQQPHHREIKHGNTAVDGSRSGDCDRGTIRDHKAGHGRPT